MSKKNKTRKR